MNKGGFILGETIYKNLGAIIGFLVITFLIQTVFGDKIAQGSCILVLLSMLIYRASDISKILKSFT